MSVIDLKQATILIVDDNPDNLNLLTRMLEDEGYETRVALNGEFALKSITAEPTDLVLLDIQMPKMDGYETCMRLKEHDDFKNIPVIFLTAMHEIFNKKKAFAIGAVDYITKPFQREELLARVKTHLLLRRSLIELETYNQDLFTRLEKTLQEKDVLIKELYHRTKNNMQVISSIVGLYSQGFEDKESKKVFKNIQNRIYSMALVHEQLYKSEDLSHIGMLFFMKKLTKLLFSHYGIDKNQVDLRLDVQDFVLILDVAIPCALIVFELLSNSLQHAFPDGRKGIITLEISKDETNGISLNYGDNGVGLDRAAQGRDDKMLGLMLLEALVKEQLKGSLDIGNVRADSKNGSNNDSNKGVRYEIRFNVGTYSERV